MMSQPSISQARILLLLIISMFAGLVVSSWLSLRVGTGMDRNQPRREQPLAVESPTKKASP